MRLKISDIRAGTPTFPMLKGTNGEPVGYKMRFLEKYVAILISNMVNPSSSHHKETDSMMNFRGKPLSPFGYVCDNFPETTVHFHINFMSYLEKCWADHVGVVVTPDIIWYTLLCEVALQVKGDPGTYRHLFTTSDKVEDILVLTSDPVVLPLDSITKELEKRVPSDVSTFFPQFGTKSPRSEHAMKAAFCDICSPYYNYMMLMCGIPFVDVRGELDDWKCLEDSFKKIEALLGNDDWSQRVRSVLSDVVQNFTNCAFWQNMFKLDMCGSGSQTEVGGWFSDLFRFQPSLRSVGNFSTHSSVVKYTNISTNRKYEMAVGLFGSAVEDDFLVPEFSFVVREVSV